MTIIIYQGSGRIIIYKNSKIEIDDRYGEFLIIDDIGEKNYYNKEFTIKIEVIF